MKVSFQTSKFYPCYPVFMLAYFDNEEQIRISTASSSYTLGDIWVLGVSKNSFFVNNLKEQKGFTINFLSRDYLREIESGGYLSNQDCKDKTEKSGLTFSNSEHVDAPVINEASLVFECELKTMNLIENTYVNIVADIKNRLLETDLFEERIYIPGKLDIPLYEGDSSGRVYRFLDNETIRGGSFFNEISGKQNIS